MSVVVSIVLQRQRRLRERDTTRQKDERTRWEWTIIASIVIGKGEARAGAGAGGGIEVVAVLEKRDAFLKQRPWSVLPSFSSSSLSSCERGVVGSFPNDDECNQSSRVPPRLANRKRNNLRKHRKRFVRSNGCDSSLLHRGGRKRSVG